LPKLNFSGEESQLEPKVVKKVLIKTKKDYLEAF
jgi:hypothetical protein